MSKLCVGNRVRLVANITDADGINSAKSSFSWVNGSTSGGSGPGNMLTTGPNTYRSGDFDIDSPGDWHFSVTARDGSGTEQTVTSTARIARPEGSQTCGTPTQFTS
jgi:hypothetical protein